MKFFALFALFVASASAKCLFIEPMKNFEPSKYFGKWYEYKKTMQAFEIGNCATANYSLNANGTYKVIHAQTIDNEYVDAEGHAIWRKEVGTARFNVTFPTIPRMSPDQVIHTDYKSYSVISVCFPHLGIEQARVLTRDRKPSKETIAAADAVIAKSKIDDLGWTHTHQENCAPEPSH